MWSGERKWTGHNRGLVWLTDLHAPQMVRFPDMVRLNDAQLLVLWEVWKSSGADPQAGVYESTQAALLNTRGEMVRGPSALKGIRLQPQDDMVAANNQATWLRADQKNNLLARISVNAQLEATIAFLHPEAQQHALAAPTGRRDSAANTLTINSLPYATVQVLREGKADQYEVLSTAVCDERGSVTISKPDFRHGWVGSYCTDAEFTHVRFQRQEAAINYRLTGYSAPAPKDPKAPNVYSIRWDGFLEVKQAGDYIFTLGSDPNAALFIDDMKQKKCSPKDFSASAHDQGTPLKLTLAPGFHHLEVRYRNLIGKGSIWFAVTAPGGTLSLPCPIYGDKAPAATGALPPAD